MSAAKTWYVINSDFETTTTRIRVQKMAQDRGARHKHGAGSDAVGLKQLGTKY